MERRRRFWTGAAAGVFLVGLGIVAARPLVLIGGAGVLGVLVVRQYEFLRTVGTATAGTTIDVAVTPEILAADQHATVELAVTSPRPVQVPVTVRVPTPAGATSHGEPLVVTLEPGDTEGTATTTVSWSLAGVYALQPATVRIADDYFRESVQWPLDRAVIVRSAVATPVHVGEGGRRIGAFGSHRSGELGTGIEPVELREYVPGDRLGRIDWKATARRGDVFVQEFEVTTDRRTVLIFDHRSGTGAGPAGGTACDYLRQVALSYLSGADQNADPVALFGVGEEGLTVEHPADTGPEHYRVLRETLQDLGPTGRASARWSEPEDARIDAATRKASELAGETTAFARTLRPFLRDPTQHVRRVEGDPLFEVARTTAERFSGPVLTVIFTDDTDRAHVREAVKVARSGGGRVVTFLAPRTLFDGPNPADVEQTYEGYRDFESFRRELARMDRVAAFEVAPVDRIDQVLAAAQDRR